MRKIFKILNRGLVDAPTTSLTKDLKGWRKERNITKADYLVFVGNIVEELLEPLYNKDLVKEYKDMILENYFADEYWQKHGKISEEVIVDTIKDIKVFAINECEQMGYDDELTDREVFKHINCRKQDPDQKEQWKQFGAVGKWKKDPHQDPSELYEPNYKECKLR